MSKVPGMGGLNIGLRRLGCRTYADYLASDHWRAFKAAYRASGQPQRCIACGRPDYQLHHRSYRRMGRELLEDVIPLCGDCHTKVHAWHSRHPTMLSHTHAALRRIFGWSAEETRERFRPFRRPKERGWRRLSLIPPRED